MRLTNKSFFIFFSVISYPSFYSAHGNIFLIANANILSVISPNTPIMRILEKILSVCKNLCAFKMEYPSPELEATNSATVR